MKSHYSAQELAELPGLPKTKSGVIRKAKSEKWQFRKQQGRGGGKEYAIDCLPQETRTHLAAKNIKNTTPVEAREMALKNSLSAAEMQVRRERGLIKTTNLQGNAKKRLEAKTALLNARHAFIEHSGLKSSNGHHQFCYRYNDNQIEIDDWVRELIPSIHPATVYRWIASIKTNGVAVLSGNYGHRKGTSKIDQQAELKDFIIGMVTGNTISHALLYRFVEQKFKETAIEIPSKRAVERWVNNWKATHEDAYLATINPDAWKNKRMLAYGDAAAHILRLNQEWQLDGTPADIMLEDGRYSLTAAIQVYSRRAIILVTKTAISAANAQLMRKGILKWGVPEVAKTDNGKDYVSLHMTRVLTGLGIEQQLSNPFSPQEKPFVERFFRTFSHDMLELMPGYIGHNVAERSAIEAKKSFSKRLYKKDQQIEIKMTASELQKFCDDWCENIYHHRVHGSLKGKTPNEIAQAWPEPPRLIKNERALDLLLQPAAGGTGDGLRTIGKKGIKIGGIYYIAPELAVWSIEHPDEKVLCLQDPDDFGRILVYGGDEFICIARSDYEGLARQEIAAKAKKLQQKAVTEAKRELKKASKRTHVKEIAEQMLQDQATHSNVTRLPVGKDHHTPELEAAAAADRARRGELQDSTEQQEQRKEHRKKLAQQLQQQPEFNLIEMNEVQRWRFWKSLDKRLAKGKTISPKEQAFYADFQNSPTYKSFKQTEDDLTLAKDA